MINTSHIHIEGQASTFNNIIADKVLSEQIGDELLEWGLKLFYFDGRKCIQA